MLKADLRQNAILIVFAFIMSEVLTMTTLGFVGFALITVLFNIKLNRYVRNALAIGIFASYWLIYGKIIDPEIGLNFLTSIIVIKILEKETVRDRYMIFFGLILLIAAGSLFERTLTYVIFFGISFFVLIRDFYSFLGQKWNLKDFALSLVWVMPLTFILFFLVPRMLNPIPFDQNTMEPGEIGYTPDVNVSEIDRLEGNQSPVFQVQASKKLRQQDLYWRANTLTMSDGWNWKESVNDKEGGYPILGMEEGPGEVKQSFRVFIRADYFFTLDHPRAISYGEEFFSVGQRTHTLSQRRWNGIQKYDVISTPGKPFIEENTSRNFTRVPLPPAVQTEIKNTFKGNTPDEVIDSIRLHFLRGGFSYSLSPGRSRDFSEFMKRKIGLCSHYASATALILRTKGIPARLVSGFMGGNYNRYADYYIVSQNDAHVWVEALIDNKWQRFDPTEWIAPDRVSLGGEAFVAKAKSASFSELAKLLGAFNDVKLWFQQWDFLFYQWLEQMDYNTQESFLMKFKFKRQWLFSLIPLLMVSFMLFYYGYLIFWKGHSDEAPHHELWRLFYRKMSKKGVKLSKNNLHESELLLKQVNDPKVLSVWNDLVAMSFAGNPTPARELKKRIKAI